MNARSHSEAARLARGIRPVDGPTLDTAVGLLDRFFREESFVVQHGSLRANLAALLADGQNWAALAWHDAAALGVVTVTTALYVEWGRLGEIGDLYVLPQARRRGIARALIAAALEACRARGCSAVSATITPVGEASHGLAAFYQRLGFVPTGRTNVSLQLG